MRKVMVFAAPLALAACVIQPGEGAPAGQIAPEDVEEDIVGPPPLSPEVIARAQPIARTDIARFQPIDEGLWGAAFARLIRDYPPLPRQETVCIAIGYEGNNTPYDPTPGILATLRGIPGHADTRFLPASQCGFDVYPFVLGEGTPATLYEVRISSRQDADRLTLSLIRAWGNLGVEGLEATVTRTASGWAVSPTTLRSVS